MVPDGWSEEPIGRRVDITHGFAFSSEHFNFAREGYRLLTPGHFFEEGGFRDIGDKQKYFSGDVPEGYLLEQGTVLVAMTEQAAGLLGSSLVVPDSGAYLHNQRLGKVMIKDVMRDEAAFLFHLFNSDYVRKEISASAGGTKVRHSSPDKI
jgi:type I restriction enzyme S subunit